MNRLTDVVKNLLIINVIVFVAQLVLKDVFDVSLGYSHFPLSLDFMPFQIVTSMFMHAVEQSLGGKRFMILYILAGLIGTFAHIAIDYVEFYRLVYKVDVVSVNQIIEGLSSYSVFEESQRPAIKELANVVNGRSLGASGAVYGVVIAFVTMFPKRKLMVFPIPIPIPAAILGVLMVGYGVVSGVGQLEPGIAHFAHLGGALTGFLMIHYWKMANLR
jgi:membrane associated rhomboid family serine protease